MLISNECYRDLYLEGKDEFSVREEAKKLRLEIAKLKDKIESPSYPYETHPFPSERDMLEACRKYLEETNSALDRMGLAPDFTAEELASSAVEANVDFIRKISLSIGIYLDKCYEIRIYDKYATTLRTAAGIPSVEVSRDKEEVISAIKALRLGEWRDIYLPEHYGSSFSEPMRWRLLVEYTDGIAPRFYEGVGVFPYNFDELRRLLGVED